MNRNDLEGLHKLNQNDLEGLHKDNRNNYEAVYKGNNCIIMENSRLKITQMLIGSRMISLLDKKTGREFMFQSGSSDYNTGEYDSWYPKYDPVGFDEMFPTIDECYYPDFPWKGIRVPDHGEVWSLTWDYELFKDNIVMYVNGVRFPYKITKRIYFKSDNSIRIEYEAENYSCFDMQFIWAAHPIINIEENSQISIPGHCNDGFTIISSSGRLGTYGSRFRLTDKAGDMVNGKIVIKARSLKVKDTEKYFIVNKLNSGKCAIKYPSDGSCLEIGFPVDKVPYLAIWMNEGGWKDALTIAIEPCTAPYDRIDIAKAFNQSSVIKAKSIYKWYLDFNIL